MKALWRSTDTKRREVQADIRILKAAYQEVQCNSELFRLRQAIFRLEHKLTEISAAHERSVYKSAENDRAQARKQAKREMH